MPSVSIDKLIRSGRKTIGMIIMPDGTLVVRAPVRASLRSIQQTVDKNTPWILRNKQKALDTAAKKPPRKYLPGEKFLFLGKEYELVLSSNNDTPVKLDTNRLIINSSYSKNAREIIYSWYEKQAVRVLNERIELYSKKMGTDYSKMRITHAERRWGSCNAKGNICFSFRLVMAQVPVIDYVVAHELVHIKEKNHSRKFWDKVQAVMPDYKEHKRWLRINQYLLSL
jgi:predicted metal-dependent hydrolase